MSGTVQDNEFDDDAHVSIFDLPDQVFDVVRNDEEQYSIWPESWEMPAGWQTVGFQDRRDACLAHIDKVWTDMRPASLRRWMESGDRSA